MLLDQSYYTTNLKRSGQSVGMYPSDDFTVIGYFNSLHVLIVPQVDIKGLYEF
jgi:hypothetical protein